MYLFKSFLLLYVYNYARVKEFSSRGVQAQPTENTLWQRFYYYLFYFSQASGYFQLYWVVSNFFPGEVGVKTNFYRKLLELVIFQEGGGSEPPYPLPLWIRAC